MSLISVQRDNFDMRMTLFDIGLQPAQRRRQRAVQGLAQSRKIAIPVRGCGKGFS